MSVGSSLITRRETQTHDSKAVLCIFSQTCYFTWQLDTSYNDKRMGYLLLWMVRLKIDSLAHSLVELWLFIAVAFQCGFLNSYYGHLSHCREQEKPLCYVDFDPSKAKKLSKIRNIFRFALWLICTEVENLTPTWQFTLSQVTTYIWFYLPRWFNNCCRQKTG